MQYPGPTGSKHNWSLNRQTSGTEANVALSAPGAGKTHVIDGVYAFQEAGTTGSTFTVLIGAQVLFAMPLGSGAQRFTWEPPDGFVCGDDTTATFTLSDDSNTKSVLVLYR